jgi:hypothetical protein
VQPRLASNSRSSCLSLLSARITGVHHQARPKFLSFLGLRNIPLYMDHTSSIHPSKWGLGWLPLFGYCEQFCHVDIWETLLWVYAQEWNCCCFGFVCLSLLWFSTSLTSGGNQNNRPAAGLSSVLNYLYGNCFGLSCEFWGPFSASGNPTWGHSAHQARLTIKPHKNVLMRDGHWCIHL